MRKLLAQRTSWNSSFFRDLRKRGKGSGIGEDSLFLCFLSLFIPPPRPSSPLAPTTLANRTHQCNVLRTYKIHLHPSVSCSWIQGIHRNMTPSLAGRPDQVCPSIFQTRQQNWLIKVILSINFRKGLILIVQQQQHKTSSPVFLL